MRSGEVLLDDVVLRRKHDHDGEFSAHVVAALKRLRPGFLRDWQAQLGSTFKNQLCNRLRGRRPVIGRATAHP